MIPRYCFKAYLTSKYSFLGESVGNKNGQEDQAGCQQCIEVTDGPLKGSYTYVNIY